MDKSQEILSQVTVFSKYAKYIPELKRRETWEELVERNVAMHVRKFPQLKEEIQQVYKEFVLPKKVLPSMRSLQFAGLPVDLNNSRMYNCSFMPVEHIASFSETMFLLLGGTGVGYSVQTHHINKLPTVVGPKDRPRKFLVSDNIEGWADAVKVLMEAYFQGKSDPAFDYRDIRPKGARLITSGGKAPGPDPLRVCIDKLRSVLNCAIGRKLSSLEVHDMQCHIADAVLAGGIRRAAMIALFDKDDYEMLTCKSGDWWELNPQRGRANNSVVLKRDEVDKDTFLDIWERVINSRAGEPGVYWTNDKDWGTNPCVEIGLKPYQFCNLTEINVSDVQSQEQLNERAKAGAFIGTLQAGYTDFHYLRPIWQDTTEEDALIGVSMTGIGSGSILPLNLEESATIVVKENKRVAKILGINQAARTTAVKPAGTTSLVVGSSSGVHAYHARYYLRRMRVGKNEALYHYMKKHLPALVEDCYFKPHIEAVMSFPQKAPSGAIYRDESYMALLERVKKFNTEWVAPGHNDGVNNHNVSCTISLKEDEWWDCAEWMWDNRYVYNGISVLPFSNHSYRQAPFEDITPEQYSQMEGYLHAINLSEVIEGTDETAPTESVACSGGQCDII